MFSIPQKMINEKHIWLNKKKDFYFKTSGSFRIKCKLSFVELNILESLTGSLSPESFENFMNTFVVVFILFKLVELLLVSAL